MEKKFSTIEEAGETKTGKCNQVQEDQNHGKAVATGFNEDSIEQEVEQSLRETVTEIGMSTEMSRSNVQPDLSHMPSHFSTTTMRGTNTSDRLTC